MSHILYKLYIIYVSLALSLQELSLLCYVLVRLFIGLNYIVLDLGILRGGLEYGLWMSLGF